MKRLLRLCLLSASLALVGLAITGCDSPGYPTSFSSYSSYGYGGGFYDPWYDYPPYYGGGTIIVNPPAIRPPVNRPRPTPLPSLPMGPRPMPRR